MIETLDAKIELNSFLLSEIEMAPFVATWGMLVFDRGVYAFSHEGSNYQNLLNAKTNEIDFNLLRKLTLKQIVTNTSPVVPIFKGSVGKNIFNISNNEERLETILRGVIQIPNWGTKNQKYFRNAFDFTFSIAQSTVLLDENTFASISSR